MPNYFLTKVWGYEPDVYPMLGFNTAGARDKFLRESRPGDWVVMAGTLGGQTPPEQRGRLLGMAQLGTTKVDVIAVLESLDYAFEDEHFDAQGNYRWPFGLPFLRALRFVGLPDVKELFGDYLPGTEWAAYALNIAEKIGAHAPALIEGLETAQLDIRDAPVLRQARGLQDTLRLARDGATGPGPSTSRAGSERAPGEGYAYMLRLEGARRAAFKVGRSTDVAGRIAQLNKGLVPSVTGCRWVLEQHQRFPSEEQAHGFEQAVHRRLRRHLAEGETEIYVTLRSEVEQAWVDVLMSGEWT